jgi:hypothetical protein
MPTKARRPCLTCGTPTTGPRCPAHARPSASARGYGRDHQRRTAVAIAAQPWCHTVPACPYDDAGTDTNPLTGGHPLPLSAFNGDKDAWGAQARIPQCRRCNVGKRPLVAENSPSGIDRHRLALPLFVTPGSARVVSRESGQAGRGGAAGAVEALGDPSTVLGSSAAGSGRSRYRGAW